MVTTREQAIEIAEKTRAGLEKIYGDHLRGVYLYGSAARGQLHSDSDIDIAIVLDEISDTFTEHERTNELGSKISLDVGVSVIFLFVPEQDYLKGRYAVYRAVKREGVAV